MRNTERTGPTRALMSAGCPSNSTSITGQGQPPASRPSTISPAPETINKDLKEHALAAEDWPLRQAIEQLHVWAERFNHEFQLGLEVPALRLDQLSARRLGTYHRRRNGFGLRHEITLNTLYLNRCWAEQLCVLLHEQLHEWQELYGNSGRGRSNYHNRQFRQKARLYGLVVDDRGHDLGVEPGRFTNLLAKQGVDMQALRVPEGEEQPVRTRRRGDSKMKKYACGCTIARCATEFVAQCKKCGRLFEEAAPLW